jgi:hypothetical protein
MVIGGIAIFFLYRYFDPKITKEDEQIENEKSAK